MHKKKITVWDFRGSEDATRRYCAIETAANGNSKNITVVIFSTERPEELLPEVTEEAS